MLENNLNALYHAEWMADEQLRQAITNAGSQTSQTIAGLRAYLTGKIQTLNETLNVQYDNLLNAINQQNPLLYIILGLLAMVTVLMIVSILNQRKLKKELRQLRELMEAQAAQADSEEDKPQ